MTKAQLIRRVAYTVDICKAYDTVNHSAIMRAVREVLREISYNY